MYKFNIAVVLVALMFIGLAGCSKKQGADKIIGKWKADTQQQGQEQLSDSMKVEIFYEFTKDKMIASGSVHGQQLPSMEIPYTIKSEGDTLVLEATHPQSGQKGEFKITFQGEKMNLIDPDGMPLLLSKE
jgi:hypothetical protein